MEITNTSNYRKKVGGAWFEPGETKKVNDISEDSLSIHFKLEDDDTASESESVEEEEEDEKDDVEEESSKPKTKDNKGD